MAVKLTFSVKYVGYNPTNDTYDYAMNGRLYETSTGVGISATVETYVKRAAPGLPFPPDWTRAGVVTSDVEGNWSITPTGIIGFASSLKDYVDLWYAYNPENNVHSPQIRFTIGQPVSFLDQLKAWWHTLPWWQKLTALVGPILPVLSIAVIKRKRR